MVEGWLMGDIIVKQTCKKYIVPSLVLDHKDIDCDYYDPCLAEKTCDILNVTQCVGNTELSLNMSPSYRIVTARGVAKSFGP